jgi:hypothetical protein
MVTAAIKDPSITHRFIQSRNNYLKIKREFPNSPRMLTFENLRRWTGVKKQGQRRAIPCLLKGARKDCSQPEKTGYR